MSTSKGSDEGSSLLYSGVCQSISDDESSSDGSGPNVKDCAFADDGTEYAEDMIKFNNEGEGNFIGKDWEWNN
eukprot:6582142-Ditylum_brightwellii.AAC.2